MTEEKINQKEKEVQNEEINKFLSQKELEILNKYIAMTKYVIGKLFPQLSNITDLSAVSSIVNSTIIQVQKEFERMEQKNQNHSNEESNKNNSTSTMDLESLLKTLSFKKSKSGKSEFAPIDPKIAQNIPQEFETKEDKFFVKKDSKTPVIIKVKKKASQ